MVVSSPIDGNRIFATQIAHLLNEGVAVYGVNDVLHIIVVDLAIGKHNRNEKGKRKYKFFHCVCD
jgi:hypothetical protein